MKELFADDFLNRNLPLRDVYFLRDRYFLVKNLRFEILVFLSVILTYPY